MNLLVHQLFCTRSVYKDKDLPHKTSWKWIQTLYKLPIVQKSIAFIASALNKYIFQLQHYETELCIHFHNLTWEAFHDEPSHISCNSTPPLLRQLIGLNAGNELLSPLLRLHPPLCIKCPHNGSSPGQEPIGHWLNCLSPPLMFSHTLSPSLNTQLILHQENKDPQFLYLNMLS